VTPAGHQFDAARLLILPQHHSCYFCYSTYGCFFHHSLMAAWFCHSTHIWLPAELSANPQPKVAGKGAGSTLRIAVRPTQRAVPSYAAVRCPEAPSNAHEEYYVPSLPPSSLVAPAGHLFDSSPFTALFHITYIDTYLGDAGRS
jgi:hypothetical protein